MDWNKDILKKVGFTEISNKEEKIVLAKKIADKVKDGDVIGFGSGSTSYLAILEIGEKIKKEGIKITAIPTSHEVEFLCNYLDIPVCSIVNKKPDWGFDGADEVNDKSWLIKGRGGAMFREKLNIANANVTYILVDKSKLVSKLGSKFAIPVECFPSATTYVEEQLKLLRSK